MNIPIRGTLHALGRTNQAILSQKTKLMESIEVELGLTRLVELYQQPCKVVGASIGQHFRHSLDHIERATASMGQFRYEIHYDLRERDTPDERDWPAARERIQRIDGMLHLLTSNEDEEDFMQRVEAVFFLEGGNDAKEVALPSTLSRELGFAAHHAIHHMAMVRIIVQQQGFFSFPSDFGRAPSTVRHDQQSL